MYPRWGVPRKRAQNILCGTITSLKTSPNKGDRFQNISITVPWWIGGSMIFVLRYQQISLRNQSCRLQNVSLLNQHSCPNICLHNQYHHSGHMWTGDNAVGTSPILVYALTAIEPVMDKMIHGVDDWAATCWTAKQDVVSSNYDRTHKSI